MSTLQNTTQHRDRIRTRLGGAAFALSVIIALGIALLILPTAHRTTRPPTASVARVAPPPAVTTQTSGLGNCLVDPYTPAIACYHAARTPVATTASSSQYRDPATHKLLRLPAAGQRAGQDPVTQPGGRIIP
jgi:hypothetical protein